MSDDTHVYLVELVDDELNPYQVGAFEQEVQAMRVRDLLIDEGEDPRINYVTIYRSLEEYLDNR